MMLPRLNRDRPEDRTTDNELEMRAFDMVLERCNEWEHRIDFDFRLNCKNEISPYMEHRMRTIDKKYLAVPPRIQMNQICGHKITMVMVRRPTNDYNNGNILNHEWLSQNRI